MPGFGVLGLFGVGRCSLGLERLRGCVFIILHYAGSGHWQSKDLRILGVFGCKSLGLGCFTVFYI